MYKEIYTPENALLLLVGDFEPQTMLKTIEKTFGKWTGKKPTAKECGGAAKAARTPSVSGAQSGFGADADFDGLPMRLRSSIRTGSSWG